MLQSYIHLDKVHVFGNISSGQVLEKITWLKQNCIKNDRININKKRFDLQEQTCVVIICLSMLGLLTETNDDHKKKFFNNTDEGSSLLSPAVDQTLLCKNFA